MIKHIVLIKISKLLNESQKKKAILHLRSSLDGLPKKISEINSYETGINISSSLNAYDIALVSEFKDTESLEAYRIHPDHVLVLKFINEIKENIAVLDYEF